MTMRTLPGWVFRRMARELRKAKAAEKREIKRLEKILKLGHYDVEFRTSTFCYLVVLPAPDAGPLTVPSVQRPTLSSGSKSPLSSPPPNPSPTRTSRRSANLSLSSTTTCSPFPKSGGRDMTMTVEGRCLRRLW